MADPEHRAVLLPVVAGGRETLSGEQRKAISQFANLIRELKPKQLQSLMTLLDEFRGDDYLDRMRSVELPAVKILADVINGWEPDGIYEFARAWVSTLIARQDGFDWERCDEAERREHRGRVLAELARRGY